MRKLMIRFGPTGLALLLLLAAASSIQAQSPQPSPYVQIGFIWGQEWPQKTEKTEDVLFSNWSAVADPPIQLSQTRAVAVGPMTDVITYSLNLTPTTVHYSAEIGRLNRVTAVNFKKGSNLVAQSFWDLQSCGPKGPSWRVKLARSQTVIDFSNSTTETLRVVFPNRVTRIGAGQATQENVFLPGAARAYNDQTGQLCGMVTWDADVIYRPFVLYFPIYGRVQ